MNPRFVAAAYCVFLLASIAFAAPLPSIESEVSAQLNNSLCFIYLVLTNVVGPFAVMVLVFRGAQYIAADDNPKKREKAKKDMIELMIALLFITVIPYLVNTVGGCTATRGPMGNITSCSSVGEVVCTPVDQDGDGINDLCSGGILQCS